MPCKGLEGHEMAIQPGRYDAEGDCRAYSKRKRQAEPPKAHKRSRDTKSMNWYEDWEQTEATRFATGVNPSVCLYLLGLLALLLHRGR